VALVQPPVIAKSSVVEIPDAANLSLARKKILVVDDEESILELVTDSLSARGCHVDCAASSEHALELANRNVYDVVLCDLNLESVDGKIVSGFKLRDRIVEDTLLRGMIHPQFIFMTGDLVDAAIGEQGGTETGKFLQKPFRIVELLVLLNEIPATVVLQPKKNAS
jgi:two-component system alkaline phosphatase synthesis response regulator PhoP